jgi:3,2-trans-enoyl-CoA isomerase
MASRPLMFSFLAYPSPSAPVNGMNLDLWSDLLSAIDATERQAKMRGAIFASGLVKDIFTAGNDLNELYSKSTTPERYHRFWIAQTTCLSRLYSTRLATVATIRGACPAGGCVFAMCCDYRLMTSDVPGAVIGLNEVALGISVPRYWIRLYERQLGNKAAELALLTGSMLTPEQAVKGGLLHAAVPKAELSSAGEAALKRMLAFPDAGRVATKRELRAEFAKQWRDYGDEEAKGAWASQ